MSDNDYTALAPVEGSKNVAVHQTPVRLPAQRCDAVVITARPGNTGPIAYGKTNAVRASPAGSEVGALLPAGTSVTFPVYDAQEIWIDAFADGEGVTYSTVVK